ncbi:MAG: DUF4127 family protein [Candidatus Bruticola sp.]
MPSLLLLPLDDRPCCWQFPQRLAEIAGCRVTLPPEQYWRGEDKRLPERANPYALSLLGWMAAAAASESDRLAGCIVSADALFYGGLVSARCPADPSSLDKIAAQFWRQSRTWPLLLFSSIMRAAPTQYTAADVRAAVRLTELSQAAAAQFEEVHSRCPEKMRAEIEKEVLSGRSWAAAYQLNSTFLSKYLEMRRRKDRANCSLLASWLQTEADLQCQPIDSCRYLAFGLDDSKTAGFNLWEAKFLQMGLANCPSASLGAGTDETAMLLLARAIWPQGKLEIVWPYRGASEQIGLYEGQTLAEVLAAQARWLGAELLEKGQGGEWAAQIFIYAPWQHQLEACQQVEHGADLPEPLWSQWRAELLNSLEQGRTVFVADLAYANGGSGQLVNWLIQSGCLKNLCGYSGWNTLGNSLGTVLAWAAAASAWQRTSQGKTGGSEAGQPEELCRRCRRFLIERLLDDYFYQTVIRPRLSALAGGSFVILEPDSARYYEAEIKAELEVHLKELLSAWSEENDWQLQVRLPWRRLFEVEINLQAAAK